MVQAQRRIHFTMAFIGGFFGVYTMLRFAGAVRLRPDGQPHLSGHRPAGRQLDRHAFASGGAALYMAGIALTVWLPLGPHGTCGGSAWASTWRPPCSPRCFRPGSPRCWGSIRCFLPWPFSGTAFPVPMALSAPAFSPPTTSASSPWHWRRQPQVMTSGPRPAFTARPF